MPIVPRDAVLLEGGTDEGDLLYLEPGHPLGIGTPEHPGRPVELTGGLSDEVPPEAEVCGEGPVFRVVAEPMDR